MSKAPKFVKREIVAMVFTAWIYMEFFKALWRSKKVKADD